MEVGGHGYSHEWLGAMPPARQAEEIRRTRAFLERVHGEPVRDWAFSYPHGSYDAHALRILREHGCALGVTTRTDLARLVEPLELARFDANDLPCAADAPPCGWTERVWVRM